MNRNICGQIFNGKKGQYSLSRRFQFLSFMMLWGKICFRFQESSRFEATAFWECPREEREVATLKKPFHLLSSSSFYASRSQMDFHILCKVKRAGWMESSHLAGSYILSYLFLSYVMYLLSHLSYILYLNANWQEPAGWNHQRYFITTACSWSSSWHHKSSSLPKFSSLSRRSEECTHCIIVLLLRHWRISFVAVEWQAAISQRLLASGRGGIIIEILWR